MSSVTTAFEIADVKAILDESSIPHTLHKRGNGMPIDKIDIPVKIAGLDGGLQSLVEITFVPGIQMATDGLSLLQFFPESYKKCNR